MDIKGCIAKWLPVYRQHKGKIDDGPITFALEKMGDEKQPGKPKSLIGSELADLIIRRGVWVSFLPTGGSGACPFTGAIVLDSKYRGEAQGSSPLRVGVVAHELTHVLQRDLMDPYYWPSGLFRVKLFTRWVGDSTNFMEVLSYIVEWVVEYDLTRHRIVTTRPGKEERAELTDRLARIEKHIATLTGPDVENAKRYIIKKFPGTAFYNQNYRKERRHADGRVPRGGWAYWLRRLQFSEDVVKHIRSIAKRGKAEHVDVGEVEAAVKTGMMCDKIVQGEFISTDRRPGSDRPGLLSQLNLHVGGMGFLILLYLTINQVLPSSFTGQDNGVNLAHSAWKWILWFGVGLAFRGLSSIIRLGRKNAISDRVYVIRWGSVLFVGFVVTMLVLLFLTYQLQVNLELGAAFVGIDLSRISEGVLTSAAWSAGFFHQLVTNFFRVIACIIWEGIVFPIKSLIGQRKEE